MKYIINYNENSISEEIFAHIKECKQRIVKISFITANDYPVGYSITFCCTPTTEQGRIELIRRLGANYAGNDVWETP